MSNIEAKYVFPTMANTISVFSISYYFMRIFKDQHEYECAIIYLRQNFRLILKKIRGNFEV